MKKRTKMMMIGLIAVMPLAASACKIDIGGGCQLWLLEPGVTFGIVCN